MTAVFSINQIILCGTLISGLRKKFPCRVNTKFIKNSISSKLTCKLQSTGRLDIIQQDFSLLISRTGYVTLHLRKNIVARFYAIQVWLANFIDNYVSQGLEYESVQLELRARQVTADAKLPAGLAFAFLYTCDFHFVCAFGCRQLDEPFVNTSYDFIRDNIKRIDRVRIHVQSLDLFCFIQDKKGYHNIFANGNLAVNSIRQIETIIQNLMMDMFEFIQFVAVLLTHLKTCSTLKSYLVAHNTKGGFFSKSENLSLLYKTDKASFTSLVTQVVDTCIALLEENTEKTWDLRRVIQSPFMPSDVRNALISTIASILYLEVHITFSSGDRVTSQPDTTAATFIIECRADGNSEIILMNEIIDSSPATFPVENTKLMTNENVEPYPNPIYESITPPLTLSQEQYNAGLATGDNSTIGTSFCNDSIRIYEINAECSVINQSKNMSQNIHSTLAKDLTVSSSSSSSLSPRSLHPLPAEPRPSTSAQVRQEQCKHALLNLTELTDKMISKIPQSASSVSDDTLQDDPVVGANAPVTNMPLSTVRHFTNSDSTDKKCIEQSNAPLPSTSGIMSESYQKKRKLCSACNQHFESAETITPTEAKQLRLNVGAMLSASNKTRLNILHKSYKINEHLEQMLCKIRKCFKIPTQLVEMSDKLGKINNQIAELNKIITTQLKIGLKTTVSNPEYLANFELLATMDRAVRAPTGRGVISKTEQFLESIEGNYKDVLNCIATIDECAANTLKGEFDKISQIFDSNDNDSDTDDDN